MPVDKNESDIGSFGFELLYQVIHCENLYAIQVNLIAGHKSQFEINDNGCGIWQLSASDFKKDEAILAAFKAELLPTIDFVVPLEKKNEFLIWAACNHGARDILCNAANVWPVKAGHVLVLPRRVVARFTDLSASEAGDLMTAAQRIAAVVQREYRADALTITIQDGPAAGQSVPHVHLHIIPRNHGDWIDNDDIYPEINRSERQMDSLLNNSARHIDAEESRKPRSKLEMAAEANGLRPFFVEFANAEGGANIWDNV
ncbi:hypothetical protein HK100_003191 [Physocladia obscura]|uniref:HIT domain-containing protein n=1 Tax=Physocladia obscura TaxID=109957 RepID=A0AAD5SUG8_9FUNG|nr:hypothetical protein HK100_003191 [Physocladia obscura]